MLSTVELIDNIERRIIIGGYLHVNPRIERQEITRIHVALLYFFLSEMKLVFLFLYVCVRGTGGEVNE